MGKEYTIEKLIAIDHAKRISKKIVKYFPEIAEDYKKNLTRKEIIKKYELDNIFKKPISVLETSISYALKELIEKEELKKIRMDHRKKGGHLGGKTSIERGTNYLLNISEDERKYLKMKSLKARNARERTEEEKILLVKLAQDPKFLYPKNSTHPLKPNFKLITKEFNKLTGRNLKVSSVRTMYCYIMKEKNK